MTEDETRGVVRICKRHWECSGLDTEAWLTAVLGDEVPEWECNGDWLMAQEYRILEFIENATGNEYRRTSVNNVYNNENDFTSVFQWQVYYPADADDWIYADDVFVAIEVHHGGDVRGNYGRVRLYRLDDMADSGFLDWMVGWEVTYSDGTPVAENDRFSIGYAQNPRCEIENHLKGGYRAKVAWSDKRDAFLAWYEDGRAVQIRPYSYAG